MTHHQTPSNQLRQNFVDAMSRVASTVNVVTTDGVHGQGGVTVTAMSSVSADGPNPQLLICLHHAGKTCTKILKNKTFCVNLLRESQHPIADFFAGRTSDSDAQNKYNQGWVEMEGGATRLSDPLAAFGCHVRSAEQVGTHYVIIGSVEDVFAAKHDQALIYANRSYSALKHHSV